MIKNEGSPFQIAFTAKSGSLSFKSGIKFWVLTVAVNKILVSVAGLV